MVKNGKILAQFVVCKHEDETKFAGNVPLYSREYNSSSLFNLLIKHFFHYYTDLYHLVGVSIA